MSKNGGVALKRMNLTLIYKQELLHQCCSCGRIFIALLKADFH